MTRGTKSVKRALAKKVTSFVLYLDQVPQIQAIVDATGADKDAQILRELIDEALIARRRKTAQQLILPDEATTNIQTGKDLDAIQTLLVKMIEESEKARCVRGVGIELLQEILAEAYTARMNSTELLNKARISSIDESTANLRSITVHEARNYAVRLAQAISGVSSPQSK